MRTLSLITLPQTLVRLFYVSLRSQALQQQYTVLCMHYGITLWAYLSEPLVKESKFDGKTTTLRAQVDTLLLRMCYGEVYGNIAREENGWLSRGKFITLLTFELSSFRGNGFLVFTEFFAL